MSSQDTLTEKIEALLAKAASTEYEAERDAFLAGARRLIIQHKIEEDKLRFTINPDGTVTEKEPPSADYGMTMIKFGEQSEIKEWKRRIFGWICRLGFCKGYTAGFSHGLVVGLPQDREITLRLLDSVYHQITGMCEAKAKLAYQRHELGIGYGKVHPRTWRQEFLNGAADRLRLRIDLILYQESQRTGLPNYPEVTSGDHQVGVSIVLASDKAIEGWVDENLLRGKKPKYRKDVEPERPSDVDYNRWGMDQARSEGYRAADRVNLNRSSGDLPDKT